MPAQEATELLGLLARVVGVEGQAQPAGAPAGHSIVLLHEPGHGIVGGHGPDRTAGGRETSGLSEGCLEAERVLVERGGADPATGLRTVLPLLRRERAIVGRFGAVPTPPMPLGPSLN